MRNVEIKAAVSNPDAIIQQAEELSKSEGIIIKQCDKFFKTAKGRLKLRQFEDGSGELIYYERFNTTGPKLSNYSKINFDSLTCESLKDMLSTSNGSLGIVNKTRRLYTVEQTRIHIDEVEGLGHFMELEVVLKDDQNVSCGEKIAYDLMKVLGIQENDMISGAYIDLLEQKHKCNITT